MIEPMIYTHLAGQAGVSALVGARIYPLIMPQDGALPALVYTIVSAVPINSLGGFSGLINPRVQIDCWAKTYGQAKALAEAVHQAMDTRNANFDALLIDMRDDYEEDTKLYRVLQDYSIWPANTH